MHSFCIKVLFLLSSLIYQAHSKDVQYWTTLLPSKNPKVLQSFDKLDDYMDATCAQCYFMMAAHQDIWKNGSIVNEFMRPLYKSAKTPQVLMEFYAKASDGKYKLSQAIPFKYSELNDKENKYNTYLSQFNDNYHKDIFLKCCSDAKSCSEDQRSENTGESQNCLAVWDGWSCWHSTKPGTTGSVTCPDMVYRHEESMPSQCSREYAYKECTSKGTWFTSNVAGYSPYTPCRQYGTTQLNRMSYSYIVGYSVSLMFTIIGSMIFLVYKQYRLLRIRIHLNFFLSLILTSIFSIAFYSQRISAPENAITCKSVTVLWKAAHLSNYCWMLIEGIYLHQLIATVAAFRDKQHALFYYIFGWGISPIIMIVFICVHSMEKYNDKCWAVFQNAELPEIIYEIVPLVCLVINAILLINIIRVLFTKLRSTPDHLRSGLKATMALMPIYGFQYLFYMIPANPLEKCTAGTFFLEYLKILLESLQGAIIASIFCFLNREVHLNIKRTIRRKLSKKSLSERVTEEQDVGSTTG